MTYLLNAYASVENGTVAIDRIAEFAQLPEEEKTLTNETSITINEAWPSTGSLTFSDFSMKYRYVPLTHIVHESYLHVI
jgi:hypothetical protein